VARDKGQALLLQEYAASHNVKLVAISIGGNNFNFASIIQTCLTDWLTSPSWWPNYCNDDSSVTSNFTRENVAAQNPERLRLPLRTVGLHAQEVGGCGFWNNDANWANATVLPTIDGAVHNAATARAPG
jgi:hypothetical protein